MKQIPNGIFNQIISILRYVASLDSPPHDTRKANLIRISKIILKKLC